MNSNERRGPFIQSRKVTPSIKKSMYTVHQITYVEYESSMEKRMEVEVAREADYKKAKTVVAEVG